MRRPTRDARISSSRSSTTFCPDGGACLGVTAVIGLSLFKGLAEYFSVYLMTGVGERLVRDLRSQLFGHILSQSAGFFARRTTGALMSRITNDINRIQHAVALTVGDLLRESATLIGLAGLLLYHDTGLALVCLTGAPVVVYPLVRLGQRVRRTTRRGQQELEHLSHISAGIRRSPDRQGVSARLRAAAVDRLRRGTMNEGTAGLACAVDGGRVAIVGVCDGSREIAAAREEANYVFFWAPSADSAIKHSASEPKTAALRSERVLDARYRSEAATSRRMLLPPLERRSIQGVSFA